MVTLRSRYASCALNLISTGFFLLLDWSHCYSNYTVVITILLTVTKYLYLKWQWIFFFLRVVVFPFLYNLQDLTIWVIRRVSYKKQELLTLSKHINSPSFIYFIWGGGGVRVVANLFSFWGIFDFVLFFVFCLFGFFWHSSCVLCAKCFQCISVIHSLFPLRFSLTVICILSSYVRASLIHFNFNYGLVT